MPGLVRAVIDTNTFVSAVLSSSSIPAQAVEKALRAGVVLRSLETWAELEDVLMREKFESRQPAAIRSQYLEMLVLALDPVSVLSRIQVCRHPKDDKFLELAVDGAADVIITGDKDLLVLHPFRGIEILAPLAYLEQADG